MTAPVTCSTCATPVGEADRLCWNCGSRTAPPAEELGATRTHVSLAKLVAEGELAPVAALPPVAPPAEDPKLVISLDDEEAVATPSPADPLPIAATGFCGSCGWSFAERPEAGFCGSCGAARDARPSVSAVPAGVAAGPSSPPIPPAPAPPRPPVGPGAASGDWSPDPHELWRSIGPIDRSWTGRIRRGWQLTKLSMDLMGRQPGLVAVPFIVAGIVGVLFVICALLAHGFGQVTQVIIFLPGLAVMASVSMIGQAVITRRVAVAVSGATETNSQAFEAVRPRLWEICKWGMLSATVGFAIRYLGRGRGLTGLVMRIISITLAVIWSSMTFFVLPVVLFEGLPVGPAITRSKQLVRMCWGEGVVGVGVLSALLNLLGFAGVVLAVLFAAIQVWVLAVLVLLATIIGINVLAAVASPVFTVVLYRYATTGEVAFGLSVTDLGGAFRRSKASRRALR